MSKTDATRRCTCPKTRPFCPHCGRREGADMMAQCHRHEMLGLPYLKETRWRGRRWMENRLFNRVARYQARQRLKQGREPDPKAHRRRAWWEDDNG